jgi:hypothetical protein
VPGASPFVVTETVAVAGPEPEDGLIPNQVAFSAAVQLSVPLPLFAIPNVFVAGSGPPTAPVNESDVGLTTSVGDAAELAYAESGPSVYDFVPDHVPGRVVSVVCVLTKVVEPPPQQRSRNFRRPLGESTAIQ